jgi:hypothetical protein
VPSCRLQKLRSLSTHTLWRSLVSDDDVTRRFSSDLPHHPIPQHGTASIVTQSVSRTPLHACLRGIWCNQSSSGGKHIAPSLAANRDSQPDQSNAPLCTVKTPPQPTLSGRSAG